MADRKDLGTPGVGEGEPPKDGAIAMRVGRPEVLSRELITSPINPPDLFYGIRLSEAKLENGMIPPSMGNDWSPPSMLTTMFERSMLLHMSPDELKRRGWLVAYDETSGYGILRNLHFSALAVDPENSITVESDGKQHEAVYLGTKERREYMATAEDRAVLEYESRAILNEQVGTLLDLRVRDDLGTLVDWEHATAAKLKPGHLKEIFNLPSMRELEEMEKDSGRQTAQEMETKHELGDQVEEALFCNFVMLESSTRKDMIDLLARPRAKELISKMAKEEEERKRQSAPEGTSVTYTYDDWVKEYIGDYMRWDDDSRNQDTWRSEVRDGRRGKLTKWGNIAACALKPGEMSEKIENEFIEKFVGGACGSVEASWLATVLARDTGLYASEGYAVFSDGASLIPLGEFRFITSDDRGKFYSYMFDYKEGTRGRSSGLQGLIGRMPDMGMSLLHWAQVETGTDSEGRAIKRSVIDAWLGTAEQPMIDLVTGRVARYGIQEFTEKGRIPNETREIQIRNSEGAVRNTFVSNEDFKKIQEGILKKVEIQSLGEQPTKVAFFVTPEEESQIQQKGAILMTEKDLRRGTGEIFICAKKVSKEEGTRLGDLKYDTLERDFSGTFGTMQWLMGRENTGVWTNARNVDKFTPDDLTLNELKKMIKYIGITLNLNTLTKGSAHLYDAGRITKEGYTKFNIEGITGNLTTTINEIQTTGTETIQRNFLRNIFAARVHSARFVRSIMGQTVRIYNLGATGKEYVDVPLPNIIRADMLEALNPFPSNEKQLLGHYNDDLRVTSQLTDLKGPLNFYNETAKWFDGDNIGIIRGKRPKFAYKKVG